MEYIEKEYTFISHSGLCNIYAKSIVPKTAVKAVVQISHGMAEYSGRYQHFAESLCNHGYAVFMSDHVGHGKSISDKSMLGFFGDTDGEEYWVKDLKALADIAKQQYPNLPFFLFGHGMGSLIARKYTAMYSSLFEGVIYSGTNGKNPALDFGLLFADCVIKIFGPKYKSKLLDKMAFGAYNRKMPQDTPCDWVSRDAHEVQKFIEDEYCGYMYSVSGLKALFKTVKEVTSSQWLNCVPKTMPLLLVSGSMDPIGNYSKGVKETYEALKNTGHTDTTVKLYEGARHEILNEINKEEVISDIIQWLDKHESTKKTSL